MRNYDETRALVTGGAGFLGSNLCERLLDQGAHVTCRDNLLTGRKQKIGHLPGNPQFDFVQHDISNPIYLPADEIYNLACPASQIHYQLDQGLNSTITYFSELLELPSIKMRALPGEVAFAGQQAAGGV